MSQETSAREMAGGLIAAAMLDKLTAKGLLTVSDAREVLEGALRAIGPDVRTERGFAAARMIGTLQVDRYAKR